MCECFDHDECSGQRSIRRSTGILLGFQRSCRVRAQPGEPRAGNKYTTRGLAAASGWDSSLRPQSPAFTTYDTDRNRYESREGEIFNDNAYSTASQWQSYVWIEDVPVEPSLCVWEVFIHTASAKPVPGRSHADALIVTLQSYTMPGSGRVLRVSVLGLRVRDPRRYSVHVVATGDASSSSAESLHAGSTARTETAPISINPDFMSKHLLLRLPCALGAVLKPQAMLRCSLWAAPTLDRGIAHVRHANFSH